MPFISEIQIARLQGVISNSAARARKAVDSAKENELIQFAEVIGGAALMGFVHGKMEDANGAWNIPGTTLDVEMIAGLALSSLGIAGRLGYLGQFNFLGKYNADAMFVGAGMLAHYSGQVMRKYGQSGTFALVSGSSPDQLIGANAVSMIGSGGVPMNDVLRSALSASA